MTKDLSRYVAIGKQAKPIVLQSSKSVHYDDKPADKAVVRDYGKTRIKNQSGMFRSLSRVHTVVYSDPVTGKPVRQVVLDCEESNPTPVDPVWKTGQPKVARARPDSPFKRAGKAAASVVIVRKG